MAFEQEDITEITAGGLFTVATAVTVGVADVSISGVQLTDVLFSNQFVTISYASAVTIFALALVWMLENPSLSRLQGETKVLVLLTLGITAAGILMPGYADGTGLLAFGVVAIGSGGYWSLATTCA